MRALILTCLLLLAACTGQPLEPTRYYLLRAPVALTPESSQVAAEYSMGSVEVATYLDQAGLVQETGGGEIHIARHHQWAEPLRISLRRFLAAGAAAEAKQPVAMMSTSRASGRIDVMIDQLHGNGRGEAVLVAYWQLISADGVVVNHQFAANRPLSRDGYTALVEAEQELLRQFARQIGQSL